MKALLSLIISGALVVSGYSQTRNVLVGTNNAVVQPTNFWSADALNARTGLGLGSAATNPAAAFQPASSVLSNLVSGGSLSFTNITVGISNVTGLQSALDGKLGTNPTLAIANISNLQTTLDGKLGTNPTLQISNIASLQTALDGKLSGSFPIAISNVSGLQTSLDGKLGTNPTLAIANITGLQANLDSKLSLTGNAVNLTNFPASLLRTTGDASGLTNFPTLNQNTTGTASNVTGVVAIANGGTGTNSATGARLNLGLAWSGLTNTNAETFRTALGLGSLSTLSAVAISNVTGLQTALDAKLASNGNAINLTNFPTSLLRVDGSAAALTNFPAILLRTNGDAGGLTNFPTLNQNTTGTASNVTGVVSVANGGTGATNAANARTSLGLGTAATNPATAFQPSSTVLSNLANNDGSSLTNLTASNIGTVALASNITGTAPLATNVTGVVALANGGTGATNQAAARTALGVGASDVFVGLTNLGTVTGLGFSSSPYILGSTNSTAPNNTVLALNGAGVRSVAGLTLAALTNTDNVAFRTAIGLGTAATNPATAFQPSSSVLTNLAANNGSSLTNIPVAGVVGALPTNGDAIALTNFPALLLRTNGNGAGLTNLTAANITGTVALASNVTGTIAISNGGSGATTAGGARTNLGLGNISTNTYLVTNTAVYIDTNIVATNGTLKSINIQSDYVESPYFFVSDGTNGIVFESSEVKAITRTNLGIGAGATNTVGFGKIRLGAGLIIEEPANDGAIITFPNDTDPVVLGAAYWNHGSVRQSLGFSTNLSNFWTSASIAAGRTNLGLPLAALTNTNNADFLAAFFGANTNPVLVNSNGSVVSPTNFWQVAPITTTFIESQPTTNSSTNISPSRLLHIHSLSTNVVNTTNTIILPTNALTFEGDMALVVHKGPTNSLTQVRQTGSTNNLITLSNFNEAVEFTYYNDTWQFLETAAFTAPIYFSGTNSAANAAASRTNLGLGATWLTNTDVTNFRTAIGLGTTNSVSFFTIDADAYEARGALIGSNGISFEDGGQNITRTNLGLPLAALTNTSVTNFQKAIFYTNTAPSNIGGNLGTIAAWIEIVASNGVTYKIPAYTNVP